MNQIRNRRMFLLVAIIGSVLLLNIVRDADTVWVQPYSDEGAIVETILIYCDPFPIGDQSVAEYEDEAWQYCRGHNSWERLTQNHINFVRITVFLLSNLVTGFLLWLILIITTYLISPD